MTKLKSALFCLSAMLILGSCTPDDEDIILNQVPLADAGPSQTVQLPISTATVTGSGTDTDGTIEAYLWSQVAGPNSTMIMNPGAPSTTISGFIAGTYVFQLMVTDDDGATGVDRDTIVVLPTVQKTLTLQPSNSNTEALIATLNGADASNMNCVDMHISRWTNGGSPYTSRSLIKFDLSSIPANAVIESAQLYLYSYPPPTITGNGTEANFGPTNALLLSKVTAPWSESNLSWANQPAVTTTNQISIPNAPTGQLDLNLDVKAMVGDMVSTSSNNGFQLRLADESNLYNVRIFVSSSTPGMDAKHPKLVVTYH